MERPNRRLSDSLRELQQLDIPQPDLAGVSELLNLGRARARRRAFHQSVCFGLLALTIPPLSGLLFLRSVPLFLLIQAVCAALLCAFALSIRQRETGEREELL